MANFGDAIRELEANDVDAAIHILKELWVDNNDLRAACKLGDIFHDGHGGTYKNDILAARWYFVAAKRHYGEAQYRLGEFFINGTGVPQNSCQAYKWYSLATMNGYDGALNARDRLGNSMRPERVSQAQDLAWDFAEGLYETTPT